MQMQANFMVQASSNEMNNAQFESRAQGQFLGGAIQVGQLDAGVSHFNDFMSDLTGGFGMGGPPPGQGGFGGFGFGALGGQANNPNTASGSMIAGIGGGYEAQPLMSPDPYANQGAYGQPAYGQPAYDQPAYGQPAYGQPAYDQPAYGQPSYGQQGTYQDPNAYNNGNAYSDPYAQPGVNPGFNPFGNNQPGYAANSWGNPQVSFESGMNLMNNQMNAAMGGFGMEQPPKKKKTSGNRKNL